MEMNIHKKPELLSFTCKDKNNDFITSSNLYGSNFRYTKNGNIIAIKIDLEKNLKNYYADDMNDFVLFHKELKTIGVKNKHIIKKLISIVKFNQDCKYFLELSIGQNKIKRYTLSFEDNKSFGINLNLDYIEN